MVTKTIISKSFSEIIRLQKKNRLSVLIRRKLNQTFQILYQQIIKTAISHPTFYESFNFTLLNNNKIK